MERGWCSAARDPLLLSATSEGKRETAGGAGTAESAEEEEEGRERIEKKPSSFAKKTRGRRPFLGGPATGEETEKTKPWLRLSTAANRSGYVAEERADAIIRPFL